MSSGGDANEQWDDEIMASPETTDHPPIAILTNIGARIKFARERANFTQSTLARAIGVSSQVVNQWESEYLGKRPNRDNLFRVARATSAPIDWLMFGGVPPLDRGGRFASPIARVGDIPMMQISDALAGRTPARDAPRISSFFDCGDNAYYVTLPDQANAPDHPKGSVWVLDPDAPPEPHRYVFASCGLPARAVFGRVRYEATDAGRITIIEPANALFPAHRSDIGPLTILAVMTESVRAGA